MTGQATPTGGSSGGLADFASNAGPMAQMTQAFGMNNNFVPSMANINSGTSLDQINEAYGHSQAGLAQQQNFVNALNAQNGIGNQSNVFGQQQALANQLQGVANGTGPNPAMAQLNNTTGQNVQNQAAMMAGQRGAGANVGLMARQAAMQGANTQQQAVGQGAVMQAQQQLAGMNALGQQQANMANLSTQQVGQQANAINGYNTMAQGEQGQLLGANTNYNNALVSSQNNVNNNNTAISQGNQNTKANMFGGMMSAASSMGGAMMGAEGGTTADMPKQMPMQHFDMGGTVQVVDGPASSIGRFVTGAPVAIGMPTDSGNNKPIQDQMDMSQQNSKPPAQSAQSSSGGGTAAGATPAAKGTGSLGPMMTMAKGGMMNKAPIDSDKLAAEGKPVPGKAPVKGNSLANDKVPAMLSPKEIVIPRSITMADNAPEKAAAFVAAILAKHGQGAFKRG